MQEFQLKVPCVRTGAMGTNGKVQVQQEVKLYLCQAAAYFELQLAHSFSQRQGTETITSDKLVLNVVRRFVLVLKAAVTHCRLLLLLKEGADSS